MNKCCEKKSLLGKNIKILKRDFDILNDENRLRILCLLKKHNELCVCEIHEALNLSQNLTSYHLNKLKEAGFLESKKTGVKVIYYQKKKKFIKFQAIINNLIPSGDKFLV